MPGWTVTTARGWSWPASPRSPWSSWWSSGLLVAESDVHLTIEEFEARVERAAGSEVAGRVRALDRWLEGSGAHLDAFLKTTMVSMFPWWSYEVPRQRLPVIWPLAIRIEGVSAERVMI